MLRSRLFSTFDRGLLHADMTFGNSDLGTCLDYTRDEANNRQPNFDDYDFLYQRKCDMCTVDCWIASAHLDCRFNVDISSVRSRPRS